MTYTKTYLTDQLFKAIKREKSFQVCKLIKKGADIQAQDKNGETPLILSAWRGSIEMTKMLLDAGANVEVKNKDGKTPLMIAKRYKDTELIKLLIDKGAKECL